jgi:ATP-dependent DNA helicase DinG
VASASFWEGFDVPGDALQLVVIDKLPFPPPNDPLVEARSLRLECLGKSAFSDYSLPEAAVALKQGAGRLIRSETDRGLLVVCDPRLSGMSYGRRLMSCLPPMRRIDNESEFELAVMQLTKTSTTSQIS